MSPRYSNQAQRAMLEQAIKSMSRDMSLSQAQRTYNADVAADLIARVNENERKVSEARDARRKSQDITSVMRAEVAR